MSEIENEFVKYLDIIKYNGMYNHTAIHDVFTREEVPRSSINDCLVCEEIGER